MFRSDKMAYCEMFLQPETAFLTMSLLGEMGRVQFFDMNDDVPPFLRNYVAELCRMSELERKLGYIESEIEIDGIEIPTPLEQPHALNATEITKFENVVEKWEADILNIAENETNLKQDVLEMKEMNYVLETMGSLLGSSHIGIENLLAKYKASGAGDINLSGRLYVTTGVVKRSRSFSFQLMLWRISRGNIYYRQADYDEVLEDPYTGHELRKVAFLTFCQGEVLAARMDKVFTGFGVNIYPCPKTASERLDILTKVQNRIVDLEEVLEKAKYYRCRSLRMISKKWKTHMIEVRKAKAIYNTMNLFTLDITKNCLIGHCWIPEKDLDKIQAVLTSVSDQAESNIPSFVTKIPSNAMPPTIQRTNKFTYGFQMLINAYGDSKYGELNPGLYTVITFPFLFAVMFGDMGHSIIMISFAAWMVIMEQKFLKQHGSEIWNIFFGGRYVILLLGMFSVVTGFIYNDIFSKSFNLDKSMWANTASKDIVSKHANIEFTGRNRLNTPYIYGVDPIWTTTHNKIMIDNSMKMKMSLIIGVIHMLFGIILSLFNHIHYKKYYLIILQFIPEFTFLFAIFFWLVFLIFYKWVHFWDAHSVTRYGSSCAPQILILFIDMVLYSSTEKKPPEAGCAIFLFDWQQSAQAILVTVGLVMVPVLLFGTPVYVSRRNKKMKLVVTNELSQFRKYQSKDIEVDNNTNQEQLKAELEECSVPFAELFIHQAVHTIEFVLSTISHTASYLRLWALSLAHAQLSEMLWGMVLSKQGLQDYTFPVGAIKLFIVFPIWAGFTVAILVVMEGLSAFLHTLRLHWVEFMSKFFIGGGEPFSPFHFKGLLQTQVKSESVCTYKMRQQAREDVKSAHVVHHNV